MADTSIETNGALLEGPAAGGKPGEAVIARVANEFGVHPLRQVAEIFRMRLGAQKLSAHEYYDLRVFDPALSKAEKRAFLGQGGINALNRAINPDTAMEAKNFVGNKLTYTAHLAEKGLPTTHTQAFVSRDFSSSDAFVLSDAEMLVDFLENRAAFPLFGKPQGGSLSVGSVRIEAREGDKLVLGDGKRVAIRTFAEDVLRVFGEGYLIQSALQPHAALRAISGEAVGCIRIVTGHDGGQVSPIYAVWKLPAPQAMSDNFWQTGSMLAPVALDSGTLGAAHRGKGPDAEQLQRHPVSGAEIAGVTLPHWQALCDTACAAHALTPDLGVCGFDMALTEQGPVIVECNDQPNHMLWQFATRTGAQTPELSAIWQSLKPHARKQQ